MTTNWDEKVIKSLYAPNYRLHTYIAMISTSFYHLSLSSCIHNKSMNSDVNINFPKCQCNLHARMNHL